jgi:uncharacterized protein (DUF983 family)
MQERPRNAFHGSPPPRPVGTALLRGATLKCPACGVGAMFHRYLKVADHCPRCGEVEMAYRPPLWLHGALWVPLTLILTLVLLPSVKGTIVALQWALYMHGFDPNSDEEMDLAGGDAARPRRLDFRP